MALRGSITRPSILSGVTPEKKKLQGQYSWPPPNNQHDVEHCTEKVLGPRNQYRVLLVLIL